MSDRRIEYHPLDELVPARRNPKHHDLAGIRASIDRFGFVEPIVVDERTGRLISGHGRMETLAEAELAGIAPPDGVKLDDAGRWTVPVVHGWSSRSDADADALLVGVNNLVTRGGWNPHGLFEILDDLSRDLGADGLLGTGYETQDLDALLLALDPGRQTTVSEHDRAEASAPQPVIPTDPITKTGDVWLLGEHRLMCGDCRSLLDVERLLDGATINLAVTSPPYAEQRDYDGESGFVPIRPEKYVEWFAPVAANVAANLAVDGSWLVNIKPPGGGLDTDLYVFDLVIAHVRSWGWHFATEYCWERLGVPKAPILRLKNQFEPVYAFARDRWKFRPRNVRYRSGDAILPLPSNEGLDRSLAAAQGGASVPLIYPEQTAKARRGGVGTKMANSDAQGFNWAPGEATGDGWAYPGNRLPTFLGSHEATGHPAAYPVGLPAFLTRLYTDEGDVVFDPFVGSGSTILAAEETSRRGFGMELSPAYCDVILQRWQRRTGVLPVLDRTGNPVDVLAHAAIAR